MKRQKESGELQKPIKFAVVGCGNIGKRHLAVLDSTPDAELVAYCDVDSKRREDCRELYPGVAAFDSIDAMLAGADAVVVNVCTPHYLHAEHAIRAAAAGRHVLVEKPMALTVSDADRMTLAAREAGVFLAVVKQNRYNVPVTLVKRALREDRLGRILMAECNVIWNRFPGYYSSSPWLGRRAFEGGALFTQVSHFIDLLIWFCGELKSATADIDRLKQDVEIEDCGAATMRLGEETICSLVWTTCAYSQNYEGSITLVGERGLVKIGGQYLNRIDHWNVEGFPLPENVEWLDKPNSYGKYQGSSSNHDKVIADVIRSLRRGDVQLVTGEEGRKTVHAIERIYGSCMAWARPEGKI